MFKEERETWFYFAGILVMIVLLLLFTQSIWIPFISGENKVREAVDNLRVKPAFTIDLNIDYLAEIRTNLGTLTVDLYEKNAPNNVNNFIYLSQLDYYDGTEFYRLVPGLLVQGGDRNTLNEDPEDDGLGNTGYILNDEINFDSIGLTQEEKQKLLNAGYTSSSNLVSERLTELSLAMANAGPNTNSSQFFIIIADPRDSRLNELNGRFTVIGKVISGIDVINQIRNTPVNNPNLISPRPDSSIKIETINILNR